MNGLPTLPDGMFFEVRQWAFGSFRIEIREKRKRFGSRVVESRYFYPGDYATGKEAIRKAAIALNNERVLIEQDRAKYREVLELTSRKGKK